MPSYEPTPRRFSIISVSRTASRRNSIDEPSRPVFDRPPPTPSSPVDLARALQKLQHVRDGSEAEERGRSRQSVGERAIRTTWGHDEPIKVPAARRESSASTRDRIAIWEQRSRSQSKGRSKSRGRGLEAGSRISVVPEVPELLAALAQLQTKDRSPLAVHSGTNFDISTYEKGEVHRPALGGNANGHAPVIPDSELFETPFEAYHSPELRSKFPGLDPDEGNDPFPDPWKSDDVDLEETPEVNSFREQPSRDHGVEETLHAVSARLENLVVVGTTALDETSSASILPTPILAVPESLPTPMHTPPPVWCVPTLSIVERAGSAGPVSPMTPAGSISTPTKTMDGSKGPEQPHGSNLPPSSSPTTSAPPPLPSTPVMTASNPAMPLTPEATPNSNKTARTPIEMTFERRLTPTPTLCDFEDALTSTPHQSPLVEPTYRPIEIQAPKDTDWDEGTADHFHLPPSLLADGATRQEPSQSEIPQDTRSHGWPSKKNASPPSAEPQILAPEEEATGYHNVWRIKEYEPEFLVPKNSAAASAAEIRRLTDVDFSGNPLQDPPKSQLSAEAEPFRPIARDVPNPYPYSSKPGGGDFAVHIPTSPTSTYRPRLPPRNRPARRDPPGRYTARRGTTGSQGPRKNEWDALPVIERAIHAASIGVIQGLTIPTELIRGLRDSYYPPPGRPDIVKAYQPRRRLPVRQAHPHPHPSTHLLTPSSASSSPRTTTSSPPPSSPASSPSTAAASPSVRPPTTTPGTAPSPTRPQSSSSPSTTPKRRGPRSRTRSSTSKPSTTPASPTTPSRSTRPAPPSAASTRAPTSPSPSPSSHPSARATSRAPASDTRRTPSPRPTTCPRTPSRPPAP